MGTQDTPITNESEAMEVAEAAYSAGNLTTCDGYYEFDLDAAARVIATALEVRDARIAELEGALEDVCNPLRILQRHADEQGRQLNGMAYSIANNLAFVQQHARAILTKGKTHD